MFDICGIAEHHCLKLLFILMTITITGSQDKIIYILCRKLDVLSQKRFVLKPMYHLLKLEAQVSLYRSPDINKSS